MSNLLFGVIVEHRIRRRGEFILEPRFASLELYVTISAAKSGLLGKKPENV